MASPVASVKVRLVCSACGQPLNTCFYDPDPNHVSWVLTSQSLDHLDAHNAA